MGLVLAIDTTNQQIRPVKCLSKFVQVCPKPFKKEDQ
jgi:hypothetical protein